MEQIKGNHSDKKYEPSTPRELNPVLICATNQGKRRKARLWLIWKCALSGTCAHFGASPKNKRLKSNSNHPRHAPTPLTSACRSLRRESSSAFSSKKQRSRPFFSLFVSFYMRINGFGARPSLRRGHSRSIVHVQMKKKKQ